MLALVLALCPAAAGALETKRARSVGKPHATRPRTDPFPAVALFGAHVQEALTWKPLDAKGRESRVANRELEHLLRCRQTGQRHAVNPRLADALYRVGRHFPGHRVEIFSGFRPRAFCNRSQSRHMSGSAVDFHVDGVDNRTLVAYLRQTFHPAGIGFYPHGVHVHLDLQRQEDAYWVEAEVPQSARVGAAPQPEVDTYDTDDGADAADAADVDDVDDVAPVAVRPAPPDEDPGIVAGDEEITATSL